MTEGLGSGAFFLERDGAQTLLLLNEAVELDRDAMGALFRTRVVVNQEFAEQSGVGVAESNGVYTASLLGVLNSVLRVDGLPLVTACYCNEGDEMRLSGFVQYHPVAKQ